MKSFTDQAGEEFEKYWEVAPLYPVLEERGVHKVTAKTAFYAGVVAGVNMASDKILKKP